MTRELKFRAWDSKEKKWLFGYDLPNLGGFSLIGETILMGEFASLPLQKLLEEVVIMQYTGLKDKNGKEIYEGDLIRLADKYTYDVRFEDGKFICYHVNHDWGKWGDLKRLSDHDFLHMHHEVIGNIYETPELLTQQTTQ